MKIISRFVWTRRGLKEWREEVNCAVGDYGEICDWRIERGLFGLRWLCTAIVIGSDEGPLRYGGKAGMIDPTTPAELKQALREGVAQMDDLPGFIRNRIPPEAKRMMRATQKYVEGHATDEQLNQLLALYKQEK